MIATNTVIEYDIQHAGATMLYSAGLINKKIYNELLDLPKKSRNVTIGCMLRDNAGWKKQHEQMFKDHIEEFKRRNKLENYHILDSNKDAIWVNGKICTKLKIWKAQFIKKQEYNLVYVMEHRNIRFYINTFDGSKLVRGMKWNKDAKICKAFWKILTLYEAKSKYLYRYVHKILKIVEENPDWSEQMLTTVDNLTLMKDLLKNVL